MISLLLFTAGLDHQEVVSFDSRFYLFALEMWQHGVSSFPTTYHQPYPDYPVTSTLLGYLVSLLFGGVSKLTVVLPSAIAAALTVVMTYQIGSLHHRRYGFAAACMLLFTLVFFKSARSIALDMYPALGAAACFYLVYSAEILRKPYRIAWIYPIFVLSFAFRGPIGLVIPAGVVCVYYLMNRDYRRLIMTGMLAAVLLSACTAALLALAYYTGGETLMRDVLRMQIAGRIDNYFLPFYFYFTNSFVSYALAYPLAVMTMIALVYSHYFRRLSLPDFSLLWKLTGWALVILLGMSIPGDKKIRYILPMAPAIALLAAYPLAMPISSSCFVFLRRLMTMFFLGMPFLFLCAVSYAASVLPRYSLAVMIPFLPLILFLGGVQVISGILYFKYREKASLIFLPLALISFLSLNFFVIEPIELAADHARDFVTHIETVRLLRGAKLVFYRENPDGMPIKYRINMTVDEQAQFLNDEKALMQFAAPAVFISSETYFRELPPEKSGQFKVIERGKIGHVNVVVFMRENQ